MAERPTKKRKTSTDKNDSDLKLQPPLHKAIPVRQSHSTQMPSSSSCGHKYGPDDLVLLLVRHGEQRIYAHAHRLARNSEFLRSALKREWLEGQTGIITLLEVDPETVLHYLDFEYGGTLPSDGVLETKAIRFGTLFKLYAFGERVLNTPIRNAILKETVRLSQLKNHRGAHIGPSDHAIRIIYESTVAGSPARRLLVDIHVCYGKEEWLENLDSIYFEHVAGVAKELTKRAQTRVAPSAFRQKPLKAEDYLM